LQKASSYRPKETSFGCSGVYKAEHRSASIHRQFKEPVSPRNRVSFPGSLFSKFLLRGGRVDRADDLYDALKHESEEGLSSEANDNLPYLTLWDCVSENGLDEMEDQRYHMSSEETRTINHDISFFSG